MDLRLVRTYNHNLGGAWLFGIAGVPIRVDRPDGPPAGETEYPKLYTADGAGHQTGPVNSLLNDTRFVTAGFWYYDATTRTVKMPNGWVATYESGTHPGGAMLQQVTDPYGNTIVPQWVPGAIRPLLLDSVTQTVGSLSRTVDIEYGATPALMPTTMTFGDRTWTYTVEDVDPNPLVEQYRLRTVEPPDGGSWQFDYQLGLDGDLTVTTPHGGTIHYDFADQILPSYESTHVSVVRTRTTGGRGINGGAWQFLYVQPAGEARGTVTFPDGRLLEYFHTPGDLNAPPLGSAWLLSTKTLIKDGVEAGRVARTYEQVGVTQFRSIALLDEQAITQGGQNYTTQYDYSPDNYGDYHNPSTISEFGELFRETRRTYQYGFGPFITGRVAREDTIVDGIPAVITRTWDLATGFLSGENRFSIPTAFGPDAFGNVATVTDAHGHTTHHTYEWGVLKVTTTPEDVDVVRVINPDGTVASETSSGATTEYDYDGLGRVKLVEPPLGDPIVTVYDPNGESVTTSRGGGTGSQDVRFLDGFGRVIETQSAEGVRTKTQYDAFGRKTSESLPYLSGSPPGTGFVYDALDRLTTATTSDGKTTVYEYQSGIDVEITDSEGRTTFQNWSAFGDPADAQLTSIRDAAAETWRYEYNTLGRLRRVDPPLGQDRTWTYRFSGGALTDLLEAEFHPESGLTTYGYVGGRLQSKTTQTATFEFHYDLNDRLRQIDDLGGTAHDVSIDYDTSNNRTRVENAFLKSTFDYDGANRLKWRRDVFPGQSELQTTYTYDGSDNLETITYPSGRLIVYDYDRDNRVREATSFPGDLQLGEVIEHHPSGAMRTFAGGNGIQESYGFHPHRYWPTGVSGGPLSITYQHDTVGNVRAVLDARGASFSHGSLTYDDLDRLTMVSGMGATSYAYDALGNRTLKTATGLTYQYLDGTNRLTKVTGALPNPEVGDYLYDDSGNLRIDPSGAYTYTPFNMMETATVAGTVTTYRYDGDNVRKIKSGPAGVRYFIHGPANQLLVEYKEDLGALVVDREYVYLGSRLIASFGDTTPPPPPAPVSVHLTSPQPGHRQRSGEPLLITAVAAATSGSVARVEFYLDGFLLGSDSGAPYEAVWHGPAQGTYRLQARAVNAAGKGFPSLPVTFTVFAAGTVKTLTVTPNPIEEGQSGSITVNGTGPCGAIQIDFGDGSESLTFATEGFPFTTSHVWTTPGLKTVTALGHGEACHGTTTSGTVDVRSNRPVVVIESPNPADSFPVGASVAITASASDPDGTISQVQFFVGGTSIGIDTVTPYQAVWTPATHGQYELTARATDNDGKTGQHSISVEIRRVASVSVLPENPIQGQSASILVSGTGPCGGLGFDYGDGSEMDYVPITSLPYSRNYTWTTAGTKNIRVVGLGSECPGEESTSISVGPNTPPAVSLTSPAHGSFHTTGTTVNLSANASDAHGIAAVEFYQGATLLGSDSTSPYQFAWTGVPSGTYSIRARAIDTYGMPNDSTAVTIDVQDVVSVAVTPALVSAGDTAVVTVYGSSVCGAVTVDYGDGTVLTYAITGLPISNYHTWTTSGVKTITATGQSTCIGQKSTSVNVNAPPSVTLTQPVNGNTYVGPATISLAATASDADGSISQVDFYVNGSPLFGDSAAPYSFTWNNVANGSYTFTATAVDNRGVSRTSSPVSVTVNNPGPSVVTSLSLSATTVSVGQSVTITVLGTNPCGLVQLNFGDGNAPYVPIEELPYTTSYAWSAPGTYTLTATGGGNCSGQASRTIIVQ